MTPARGGKEGARGREAAGRRASAGSAQQHAHRCAVAGTRSWTKPRVVVARADALEELEALGEEPKSVGGEVALVLVGDLDRRHRCRAIRRRGKYVGREAVGGQPVEHRQRLAIAA